MTAFAASLAQSLAGAGRAVVVAIAHGTGSVPREPGAWMIVTAHAQAGTIGGGHLEHEATKLAREAIGGTMPPATWLVRFPLAARLGQCCGGVATIAFAVVDAADGWLDVAQACERTSADFALVHRLGADRDPAQRLVVTADDSRGTLGDDALDSAAVVAARARRGRCRTARRRSGRRARGAGTATRRRRRRGRSCRRARGARARR